jgi:hypothetical protein
LDGIPCQLQVPPDRVLFADVGSARVDYLLGFQRCGLLELELTRFRGQLILADGLPPE